MKNMFLETKNLSMAPCGMSNLAAVAEDRKLPMELPVFRQGAEGGVFFSTVWKVVKKGHTDDFAWVWFDKYSVERRDVMLHIWFCEPNLEEALAVELINEVRFRAISQKGIQYLYIRTEDAKISLFEACGFRLKRQDEEAFILEYQKHSSEHFPLYVLLAIILFIPLRSLLRDPVTAMCVGMCLAFGGGTLYDIVQKNRFAVYRARLIYGEDPDAAS